MILLVKIKILGTILWQKICFVVVEVYGFGAVWICRSMPTFRRNTLSPSSGAEVTRQGNPRLRKQNNNMRFQVLTAARMKFRTLFWDVLPY